MFKSLSIGNQYRHNMYRYLFNKNQFIMHCVRDKDCQYLFQCFQNQCIHTYIFDMDGLFSFALVLLLVLVSISLFARVSAGSVKYIIFILILNYNADVANLMTQCSMFGSALILFYLSLIQSHPLNETQPAINNNIVILVIPMALFSLNLGRFLQSFTSLIVIEGIAFFVLIPILVLYAHQYKQQKIAEKIASGQLKNLLPRRYSQINDKIRKSRLTNTLELVVIHEQQQKNQQSHIDDNNYKSKHDSLSQNNSVKTFNLKTQQGLGQTLLQGKEDYKTLTEKNTTGNQSPQCMGSCIIKYPWVDIAIGISQLTIFITVWVLVQYYINAHYLKILILLFLTLVQLVLVLWYLNTKHAQNYQKKKDLDLNIFKKKYSQDSELSVDGLRNVMVLTVVSFVASIVQGYAFLGFCQTMLLLFLFSGVPSKVAVCTISYLLAMFSVFQLVSCLYFYSNSANQQIRKQFSVLAIVFLIAMCSVVAFSLLFMLKKIFNKRSAQDKILIMGIVFTAINILGIFGAILKNVV